MSLDYRFDYIDLLQVVVAFCVFLVTLPSLNLLKPPHIHQAKLTLIHSNPDIGSLSLALGLHLVVFVSLQESIIWHGALTGSKWGYPPWPNGKTCCLLGWKVREHECISLFPVLLFPLIWSIRLGTHTHTHTQLQPPFICHAALNRVTVQIKAFGVFLENAVYLLFTDCMCHEMRAWHHCLWLYFFSHLPSTDARLGRMVMAPSATLSWPITGEILDPQLSEPTHRKWPVWLLLLAASRTRLIRRKKSSL